MTEVKNSQSTAAKVSAAEIEQERKKLIVSPEGVRTGAILGIRLPESEKEAAVIKAWQAYWKVRMASGLTASLDAPSLQAVALSDALQEIQSEVRQLKARSGHRAGVMILKPRDLKFYGTRVSLIDCVYDQTYTILEDDSGSLTRARANGMSALLINMEGKWRVKEISKDLRYCAG